MRRAGLLGLLVAGGLAVPAAAEEPRARTDPPVFTGAGGELKVLVDPEFRDAPSLQKDLQEQAIPGLSIDLAGPLVAVPPPAPGKPVPPPVPRRILLRGASDAVLRGRAALARLDVPRPAVHVSLLLCETRCLARKESGGFLSLDRRAYPAEGSDTLFRGVQASFEPESFLRSTLTGVRPFEGTSVAFGHGAGFEAVLRMLQRRGEAEFLVHPCLLLTEEQPGSIESIVNLPQVFVARSGTDRTVTTEAVETGVRLAAKALRIGRDHVTLEIRTWIRLAEPATGPDQDPRSLVLHTREVRTQVTVRDGESALLGGLKVRRRVGSREGLPLAMRVPALSPFVSARAGEVEESDLVLLVQPRIVVPGAAEASLSAPAR